MKDEVLTDVKTEVKEEVKEEVKDEVKDEVKVEVNEEVGEAAADGASIQTTLDSTNAEIALLEDTIAAAELSPGGMWFGDAEEVSDDDVIVVD